MATQYFQSDEAQSAIGMSPLIGAVLGQVFFGSLADRLGRKKIFVATICLVMLGALGSSSCTDSAHFPIYAQLCMWLCKSHLSLFSVQLESCDERLSLSVILGFGVGGEYPLSATVSSEGSSDAKRGKAVSSVFAMQVMF
jgi:PHS family inorganic phosphate transporter-like MFS transporter